MQYSEPKPIHEINGKPISACSLNWIVEHLVNSKEYFQLVKAVTKGKMCRELLQELSYDYLTRGDLDKFHSLLLAGKFHFFFVDCIQKTFFSSTSTFHNNWRKQKFENIDDLECIDNLYKDDFEEDIQNDISIEKYNDVINNLDWYDHKIFTLYNQHHSVPKISNLTKIPESALYETLRKVRIKIKQELKK